MVVDLSQSQTLYLEEVVQLESIASHIGKTCDNSYVIYSQHADTAVCRVCLLDAEWLLMRYGGVGIAMGGTVWGFILDAFPDTIARSVLKRVNDGRLCQSIKVRIDKKCHSCGAVKKLYDFPEAGNHCRACGRLRDSRKATTSREIRNFRMKYAGGGFTEIQWRHLKAACGNRCLCCGKRSSLTKDHIVPISRGGTDGIDNIQPLCRSCNSRKFDKTIDYRDNPTKELAQVLAFN